jgi:molecular chaperone DnaJ
MADYYATLGVDRNATQEDIKQAFRKLAREHHPDVRQDDPKANDRFKEINEAYQALSDPERRAHYDRFGTVPRTSVEDATGSGPFDDIFDMFFGRRSGRADRDAPEAGADLRVDLELTLEESARGLQKTIEVARLETCPVCFGTGAERGSTPEQCPTCGGRGEVQYAQRTVFGSFTQVATCHTCGGAGTVLKHPCKQCRGNGRVEVKHTVTVTVPAGVDDDMRLRVPGEGEAGLRGGPRGDLYVFIHMRPHQVFQRRGKHLYSTVPVTIYQAALGDEIDLPTLDGPITRAIPPGAQPGAMLTVKGKGMPEPRGGRGDLHVQLDVRVPSDLSDDERKLLEQLAALRGQKVKPPKKKLADKVKDMLP